MISLDSSSPNNHFDWVFIIIEEIYDFLNHFGDFVIRQSGNVEKCKQSQRSARFVSNNPTILDIFHSNIIESINLDLSNWIWQFYA